MNNGSPSAFHTDGKDVESQCKVGGALHGTEQRPLGQHDLLSDQTAVGQTCVLLVHHVGHQSIRSLVPWVTGVHIHIFQRGELILVLALCAHDPVAKHHGKHVGMQLDGNGGGNPHGQLLLGIAAVVLATTTTHPDVQTGALRVEPQRRDAIALFGCIPSEIMGEVYDASPAIHSATWQNVKLEFELLESLNPSKQRASLQTHLLLAQQLAEREGAHGTIPHVPDGSICGLVPGIRGENRHTLARDILVTVGSTYTSDLVVDEHQHVGSLDANPDSDLLSEGELLLGIAPAVAGPRTAHPDMQSAVSWVQPQGWNTVSLFTAVLMGRSICEMDDGSPPFLRGMHGQIQAKFELCQALHHPQVGAFLEARIFADKTLHHESLLEFLSLLVITRNQIIAGHADIKNTCIPVRFTVQSLAKNLSTLPGFLVAILDGQRRRGSSFQMMGEHTDITVDRIQDPPTEQSIGGVILGVAVEVATMAVHISFPPGHGNREVGVLARVPQHRQRNVVGQ
mmetsp:Transcript_13853/g.34926  ORF Transcript_13853/g.34926 Transcript_13853/m.34926 type:complete len:510 (-) Transcript_13853:242-1771(-)